MFPAKGVSASMGVQHRLSPTMTSRKLQVYRFIVDYIVSWDGSPSYDEIAAGVGTNKSRVYAIVRQLAAEGKILHRPGARRGISLPAMAARISLDDALSKLRAAGYRVDADVMEVGVPIVTNSRLPGRPALEHIPPIEVGEYRDVRDTRRS
ncbi:hypothetical protein BH10PSE14_BH10PSE14_04540 [soil metagenome]